MGQFSAVSFSLHFLVGLNSSYMQVSNPSCILELIFLYWFCTAFHFSEIHSIARFRRHKQIKLLKKEVVQFPLFSVRNLSLKENFETLKKAYDFHCLSVIVVKN